MGSWFHRKIADPFFEILSRDAEPKQLAFSAALGVTLGVFPLCGVTMFLCGIAIALLGSHCHAPTLVLANFIATPIELSLVIPFLRLGEFMTGGPQFPLTSDALMKVLTGQASVEVLQSILHVLLGWLVSAPFIMVILNILFFPCFKILVAKFSAGLPIPKQQLITPAELRLKLLEPCETEDVPAVVTDAPA